MKRMRHTPLLTALACLLLLVYVTSCRTSRQVGSTATDSYLTSKVKLTIPHKNAVFTVNGTLKLKSDERLQVSFLMPILRSEVARIDATPDELLFVDRMGKRYAQITRDELKTLLPDKADFAHLEKTIRKAAKPNGKKVLEGKELGLNELEKARLELSDFSNEPFTLTPTQLSSRYKRVELAEIVELLIDLNQ